MASSMVAGFDRCRASKPIEGSRPAPDAVRSGSLPMRPSLPRLALLLGRRIQDRVAHVEQILARLDEGGGARAITGLRGKQAR
jgi:hypothetical protein